MTGKFNVKLTVQKPKTLDDGFSDSAPDRWEAVRNEMFSLEPTGGDEPIVGQKVSPQNQFKARCHFFQRPVETRSDGTSYMPRLRLVKEGRTFNVESVVNWMERNKFLDWQLVEVI